MMSLMSSCCANSIVSLLLIVSEIMVMLESVERIVSLRRTLNESFVILVEAVFKLSVIKNAIGLPAGSGTGDFAFKKIDSNRSAVVKYNATLRLLRML